MIQRDGIWRINPTDNNDIEPYVKKPINNKPVNQFDLDGNFIRSFVSETEAKKITGAAKVGEVCKGKRKQSGGYIWRYARDKSTQFILIKNVINYHIFLIFY